MKPNCATTMHRFPSIIEEGLLYQDGSFLLNSTSNQDLDLIYKFQANLRLNSHWTCALIVFYSVLILMGTLGNFLVVWAFIKNPALRTVRNFFIANLAVSDFLLCCITMPLTLMEVLTVYWPLGESPISCKLTGFLQASAVFVSSLTIVAIALDRYRVIMCPTKKALKMSGAGLAIPLIWILAMCLSLPNFIWRHLETHPVKLHGMTKISFCYEHWPNVYGRAVYSVFVLLVQLCFPALTVSVAYARICSRVHDRIRNGISCPLEVGRPQSPTYKRRVRKTITLLISIAVVFYLSWLPLNLFNLITDVCWPFENSSALPILLYAFCHVMGMSSACTNPLLYGWLNQNFREEFHRYFNTVIKCCGKLILRRQVMTTSNMGTERTNVLADTAGSRV